MKRLVFLIVLGVIGAGHVQGRSRVEVVEGVPARVTPSLPAEAPEPSGSEVEEVPAGATPAWFWRDEPEAGDDLVGLLTIKGRPSATEERAERDAREHLERKIDEWLGPEVPASWTPPAHLVRALILDGHVETIRKDYGTIYLAGCWAEFSPERRALLVEEYDRQLVRRRLVTLGGGLGFVLACLASLAGYIRADEATKGYYTNRLRVLAAAGAGAAGVAIYHALA